MKTCNSEENEREFCTWPDCDCGKKTSRFKSNHFHGDVVRGWREIDNRRFFFRSLWEINFARVLDFHARTATPFFDVMIERWEYEPATFYFDPEQARKTNEKFGTKLKGIRKGATSYKPDFLIHFKYFPDAGFFTDAFDQEGKIWFEVKGYMKPKDQTKIKRFRQYFPDQRLEVIDVDWFTFNAQAYRALIPTWESKNT